MGYTNYWSWTIPIADASKCAAWSRDVGQLIEYLTTPGRALPGYIYQFDPPDRANRPYNICGPDGTGEPEITSTVVAFNGDASLEDDYEAFIIRLQDLETPTTLAFCKTALNPYDLLVIGSLVRFAHYFPATRLWSDGEEEAIAMGLAICRKVLGENGNAVLSPVASNRPVVPRCDRLGHVQSSRYRAWLPGRTA